MPISLKLSLHRNSHSISYQFVITEKCSVGIKVKRITVKKEMNRVQCGTQPRLTFISNTFLISLLIQSNNFSVRFYFIGICWVTIILTHSSAFVRSVQMQVCRCNNKRWKLMPTFCIHAHTHEYTHRNERKR